MALEGSDAWSQNQATYGQLWQYAYNGDSNNSLLYMLLSLLKAWSSNMSELGADQQNKYIDMLLSQQEKQEDRQYSEEWRDNDRAYNSPTAMLNRLMATGMSRDMALQLLGGSSGSGGSSASPVVSTLPQGLGSSAIDYRNMQINDRNSVANIVLGAFQTAGSLVSAGFGAFGSIAQARNINTQTEVANQQTDALVQSSKVISAINNAIASGAEFKESDFETPQTMRSWISNNTSRDGQPWPMMKDAENILTNGGNGNPFFQSYMRQAFDDWHSQRGFKENPSTNALMYQQLYAATNVAYANVEKAVQDIVMNDERLYEIYLDELQKMQTLYQNDESFQLDMILKGQEIDLKEKDIIKAGYENDLLENQVARERPEADALRVYYNALFDQKCTELFVGLKAYGATFGNVNSFSGLNKDNVSKYIQGFNDSFESELFLRTMNRRMNEGMAGYADSPLFQFSNAYRSFGMSDVVGDFLKTIQTTNDVVDTWVDNGQKRNNVDSQDGSQTMSKQQRRAANKILKYLLLYR